MIDIIYSKELLCTHKHVTRGAFLPYLGKIPTSGCRVGTREKKINIYYLD